MPGRVGLDFEPAGRNQSDYNGLRNEETDQEDT